MKLHSGYHDFRRFAAAMALALTAFPAVASAHARLIKSAPAAGSKVVSPTQVRLVFSEVPVLAMSRLRLVNSGGDTTDLGSVRLDSADAHAIIADVPRVLAPGDYHISWMVAARDGHPSHGSVAFEVEADTAISTVAPPSPVSPVAATPSNHADAKAMTMEPPSTVTAILIRWLGFISVLLVIGVVTFRYMVLGKSGFSADDTFAQIAATNAATLGIVAAVGSLVSALLKIALESADMPGMSVQSMVLGSMWGWSLIAAALASVIAALSFWSVHGDASPSRSGAWQLTVAVAVVLAVCPSLSGHAAGSDYAFVTVPADIIHVAAGSMWLGTLAVIVIVGISAALKSPDSGSPGARVSTLVRVFSPMALTCGAIVVVTGVVASFVHLPRLNALWTTPYGSALYRKLIFVLALFAVGAWNWRKMKPTLGTDAAITPLRRIATIEVALAAIVLGLTAILVALEIPA